MANAPNGVVGNGQSSLGPVEMYPAGPGTVIIMPVGPAQVDYEYCERYKHKLSTRLGVSQVVIGLLCIIFNAIGLGFGYPFSFGLFIGHGFWSGILFIITGALGISAAQAKTRSKIIGFMVTCILSACCAASLWIISLIGAISVAPYTRNCNTYASNYSSSCYDMDSYRLVIAMQSLMAILALAEAIVAIWGSIICCQAVCCRKSVTSQEANVPSAYLPSNGQMRHIDQSQGVLYSCYPPPYPGPATVEIDPPPYQASFSQAAWTKPQPHHDQPPSLYFLSARDFDGYEHHSHPMNPRNPHSAADPPTTY